MKLRNFLTALIIATISIQGSGHTKVACIGNSITYGAGLPADVRQSMSYPGRLQAMLGDDYEVGNFGHNGATLLNHGHNPYMNLPEFHQALAMVPDVALIHLGVNDTDPRNWPNYSDEFIPDYSALIDSLRDVNPRMRIIIARLTPIGARHRRFRTGTRQWRLLEQEAIEAVARLKGVELIDFDTPLRDRQNLMPDAVHPDAAGYYLLAETARKSITGDYGGLNMPGYYQSGMVLQRHRPLTISGTANAGAVITLTLDGIPYTATTDNRGQWTVVTAPLADGSYRMTVTDGIRTLDFTDILAGEVWVASGQSNMEFGLSAAEGGDAAVRASADPLLRFYDMRPVARTDNVEWSPEVLQATDTLGYFLPARWECVNPGNAGRLSAVAYFFARRLRDSLNVPVGIISNGVGGAPCEAWIDVNTLEKYTPEILVDWRRNDYVQKWAQGRADKNAPAPHRHPYEPSYLFSAGIRPLGRPDIAGVIWYQGESNAHNMELHEQLFPMFIESWRKEFRNPELPVCFVQLSSINRPSWPSFRDSQRRLASQIPDVYMAVSSDMGDSLDVHPTRKLPVGQRLAGQALRHVYGHGNIVSEGPSPVRAQAGRDGSVTITFANSQGLTTSDGREPITFEVADENMVFHPVRAILLPTGQVMLLPCRDVPQPRAVRYAWQPFTRANLVNGEGLPTSTFKIAIDNMNELYELEPGYDRGVSAAYAGRMPDGQITVAGGCNFPCDDPLAPGAGKKFYSGIYRIDPENLALTRIGTLPQPMAYGASVSTPEGIILIGGTSPDGASRQVTMLKPDLSVHSLPSLPAAIDNMAATLCGSSIYVAGGNVNGTPSRHIYVLDLTNQGKGWKKLKDMPGNPRVQPVMASAGGRIYIWGGFAGRHNGNEPTLELNGLCYDPATGRWTDIDGPVTPDGIAVATGGAAAATLSNGSIAVAGGVNKDVFLAALIDQKPDYLNHPISWYAFNPTIYYFDPATSSWHSGSTAPLNARAGAAIISGNNNDFYLFGGELKPRIRTNRTIHVTR